MRHLRNFLSEMGNAFAFVGNQYRLEGENPPIGIIICRSKDRKNSVIENRAPAERRIADIQAS